MLFPSIKKCSCCENIYPATTGYFYKHGNGLRGDCKKCSANKQKARRDKNKDAQRAYQKEYAEKHAEKKREISRKWYAEHKDRARKTQREYYNNNKEAINAKACSYEALKMASDPCYRITKTLRCRLRDALRDGTIPKGDSTKNLLGCSIEEFKEHLEMQWEDGMSWDNHGVHGWHIDHIRPCASFDLLDPEQQRECFHYTNMQPLWAVDNLKKSKKWDGE